MKFYIEVFDDYHEIRPMLGFKCEEIGLYPTSCGYKYFALFYHKLPTLKSVLIYFKYRYKDIYDNYKEDLEMSLERIGLQ
jgi:hypothetical protein